MKGGVESLLRWSKGYAYNSGLCHPANSGFNNEAPSPFINSSGGSLEGLTLKIGLEWFPLSQAIMLPDKDFSLQEIQGNGGVAVFGRRGTIFFFSPWRALSAKSFSRRCFSGRSSLRH